MSALSLLPAAKTMPVHALSHEPFPRTSSVTASGRWPLTLTATSCGGDIDQYRDHDADDGPNRPLSVEPVLNGGIPKERRGEEDEAEK